MSSASSNEIKNWVPWKLLNHSAEPVCSWLYTGNKNFTEPFFDDTISICRSLDENCKPFKPVASLQMMAEWADDIDTVNPTAIIFHVSRCGSTLLSQLLALNEASIVLSEVPFFDDLLRLPFKNKSFDNNTSTGFLKAAIKLYGRKKTGIEKNLFIKTDSWHIHFYDSLRPLYPSVPFIFLFRNPWEVVLSQQRQRGMHAVPGIIEPGVFGFSKVQINEPDFNQYMTNVLAGYFNKMIAITKSDPLVLPVNYDEGMSAIFKKIYALPDVSITNSTEKLLNERTRFHAKHPQQLFQEKNKEEAIPQYLLPVLELYVQLNEISLAKA